MTKWDDYLEEREASPKKKKHSSRGCKKNKTSKKCIFKEDSCIYCHRPRKKVNKLDSTTGSVVTYYLE